MGRKAQFKSGQLVAVDGVPMAGKSSEALEATLVGSFLHRPLYVLGAISEQEAEMLCQTLQRRMGINPQHQKSRKQLEEAVKNGTI